tara:strand:+ start:2771 stop:3481 length:711 start_codon:yes stop_codon:yes gene_type:complete
MITILIPTLNEKKNISIIIKSLLTNNNLEKIITNIIFIDDNSSDNSIEEFYEISNKFSKVKWITRTVKPKDLTKSILLGLNLVETKYVCVMDADLQHDTKVISSFYNLIKDNKYDLIIGSRFLDKSFINDLSMTRKIMSKSGNFISYFLGIKNIKDPLSGFFMIKTSIFKSISKKIDTEGFKILLTILVLLNKRIKTKEIQINFFSRKFGKSKLKFKIIIKFLVQIFKLKFPRKIY